MSTRSLIRSITAELSDEQIELLASRVAAMLRESELRATDQADRLPVPGLVDAAALSRRLGLSRSWIYEHAVELGAIPLGEGSRARLRFDTERALAALEARRRTGSPPAQSAPERTPRPRRARRRQPSTDLLPVRGRGTRALLARSLLARGWR